MSRIARLAGEIDTADWIAQERKCWVLYLSTSDSLQPMAKDSPVPFLTAEERVTLTVQGWLMFLYDDGVEAKTLFDQVVGEDGPRPSNPYAGKHKVYAFLTGPQGPVSENT